MKFKKNPTEQKWFAYTVAACTAVVLYVVLTNLSFFGGIVTSTVHVLSPVILGIVLAYIIDPICGLFERYVFARMKRQRLVHPLSVACAVAVVILFFVILMVALIPQVFESIFIFVSNAGTYVRNIQGYSDELAAFAEEHGLTRENGFDISGVTDMVYNYASTLLTSLPERMNNVIQASYNFGVGVFNFGMAFILAIYFLLAKESLLGGFKKLFKAMLPPKRYRAMGDFWWDCHHILIRFITFDIVDGIIVGICNFIFMTIGGMPYAVLISFVVGITNLAPTFGPMAGGAIGALILLLTEPIMAVIFLIFTFILQTVDGYVIKPRLFGSSLGVPAVWILVTIIIGGNLFGVIGILLAIPFAAIMTHIYRTMIENRLEEQRLKRAAKEEEQEKAAEAARESVSG